LSGDTNIAFAQSLTDAISAGGIKTDSFVALVSVSVSSSKFQKKNKYK
jgi:hypothetical protein